MIFDIPSVSALTALTSGIISFFSPCALPLIPSFLGVLFSGSINKGWMQHLIRILGFFTGISLFFAAMGALTGLAGSFLVEAGRILEIVSGVLLIGFAIMFLFDLGLFKPRNANVYKYKNGGFFSALLLGGAIGMIWIPCASPVLGSILLIAANSGTVFKGSFLLFLYSLGISIPFLTIGGVISKILSRVTFGRPKWEIILRYIGAVLIGFTGLLVLTGKFNII